MNSTTLYVRSYVDEYAMPLGCVCVCVGHYFCLLYALNFIGR